MVQNFNLRIHNSLQINKKPPTLPEYHSQHTTSRQHKTNYILQMLFLVLAEGALNHPNSGNQPNFKDLGKKCISNKHNSYIAFLLNYLSSPNEIFK